jgi:hypothetical protein
VPSWRSSGKPCELADIEIAGGDYAEIPKIEIHSPQQGEEVVGGVVTVAWEVTFFDIVQGYVEVDMRVRHND